MVLILLLFYACLASAQEWSYRDQDRWSRNFASCGGRRQSPINIITRRMRPNPLMRLYLEDYGRPNANLIIRNDGHTVPITLNKQSVRPTLRLSESPRKNGDYVFEQMHVHWGGTDLRGSEHSVDSEFGAAEMHFVHYNRKYGSLSKAQSKGLDGLLVLTVLLKLSRKENTALQPIIRSLSQIISYNSSSVIRNLNFETLMPRNKQLFYKYEGSLTTPPCSESVTFVIFADPIEISDSQVSQFRKLLESNRNRNRKSERIVENDRDIQAPNGRYVQVSVPRLGGKGDNENDLDVSASEDRFDYDYIII